MELTRRVALAAAAALVTVVNNWQGARNTERRSWHSSLQRKGCVSPVPLSGSLEAASTISRANGAA